MVEQQYSFAEICHRKRLRWDLRMPEGSQALAALRAQVEQEAVKISILGKEVEVKKAMMEKAT